MVSNRRSFPPILMGVLVTLLLGLPFPADLLAQDQEASEAAAVEAISTATVEDVGKRGAAVLGRLDRIIQDSGGFAERLASASREDSLVIRLQRARFRDRFMEAMVELADVVVLTKDDPDRQELKVRGEAVFVAVTPKIWELIGELRTEIDQARARRGDTTAGEMAALEDEIVLLTQRLDRFFSYGWLHVQKLEILGLESGSERETLASLLSARAEELSGRLDLGALRVKEFSSRLRDLPGDADLKALLLATRKSIDANVSSQNGVLEIMDALDLPTDRYRTQLVTMTQDIAAGLLDVKVAGRLVRQAWTGMRSWTIQNGPTFLVKVLLFLVIVVAGHFLSRLVSRAVEKSLARARVNMSFLLKRMVVTFSKNAILVLALVFGLAQLGLSLGPLLAGFGVIGFILGFAMQDSLSNLAAGMMILINRPYDVGDLVEISGVFGKVEQMSMVSTSILTLDNQKLVVPNSRIWGDVIKNVTDQRLRRVDMTFGISYTDDIPQTEQVLNDILKSHDKVLDDPEPMVRLHTLNDSSVDFVVRPWVRTDDYWDVYWDVTRAVKMRFDAEDISIPFPQRDVHIYEQKKMAVGNTNTPRVEQPPTGRTGQDEPGSD